MNEGEERGRLDGVPETMKVGKSEPKPEQPSSRQDTTGGPPQAAAAAGFDFNHPTVISLLYLSSFLLMFTSIVGVVLAFVWKDEAHESWEDSHYEYLINTFWIGLVGGIISFILMFVLIGFLLLPAVAILVIVRSVLSMVNAQQQKPMPNPGTFLA